MHGRIPPFQTDPHPSIDSPWQEAPIRWMKVTAISAGGNDKLLTCVLCRDDGSAPGIKTYTVLKQSDHVVNDVIAVCRPGGGTTQTFMSKPVVLSELAGGGGLPPPGLPRQGLFLNAAKKPIWDYLRLTDIPFP